MGTREKFDSTAEHDALQRVDLGGVRRGSFCRLSLAHDVEEDFDKTPLQWDVDPPGSIHGLRRGYRGLWGTHQENSILIVGAMAISPDLWPLCATCIGMVTGRRGLAGRAFTALIIGLAAAGLAAFLITVPLRWAGYGPTTSDLADGGLGVLPTVNVVTVVVAFVAGIAGILAFETRSSSAVGVAISITTIPAAAFAGAPAAVTDWVGATAALAVLAVNIVMLLTAGTITLLIQRRRRRQS